SIALAAIMGVVAWRIAGEEERRSQARVAALAAEIHGDGLPLRVVGNDFDLRPRAAGVAMADLFTVAQAQPASRWPAVVFSGGSRGTTHAANPPAAPVPAAAPPLELVALGHERDSDGLIVRGVVRNPPVGTAVDRLTAVVFVFNRDGGFLTSGRVMIEPSALRPGGESIFVVTVPGAADAGRYRVSFRTDDRIVAHVDRRVPMQAKP